MGTPIRMMQSSATLPANAGLSALSSFTARISDQLSYLIQQTEAPGRAQATALAVVAENLGAVLNTLREAQNDLAAQRDDLAATLDTLERAHRRYHDLFELAPDAYLVTDADSRILEANQAAIRLIGYSRTYTYGRPLLSFVPPESAQAVAAHLRAHHQASPDNPAEWDMHIRARGRGPHRTVRARVRRLAGHAAPQTQFFWLLRRVPPDEEAHRAQADNPTPSSGTADRWLRVLLQTVQDATLLLRADGRIHSCNAPAVRLFGPVAGLALDDVLSSIVHPDDCDRVTRSLLHDGRPAVRNGAIQFRLRRSDGTWRDIEAVMARIPSQLALPGAILSLRDLTERVRTRRIFERFHAYQTVAEAVSSELTASATADDGSLLQRMTDLTVPDLGDECRIYLEDRDGTVRLMAAAPHNRGEKPNRDGEATLDNGDDDRTDMIDQVLNSGESILLPDINAATNRAGTDHDPRPADGRAHPSASLLLLPLTSVDHQAVGVLMLRYVGSGRRHGEEDLLLGRDLARQMSLLIECARLIRQARPFDAVTRALAREQGELAALVARRLHASLDDLHVAITRTKVAEPDSDRHQLDRSVSQARTDADRLGSTITTMLDFLSNAEDQRADQRRSVEIGELVEQVIAEQELPRQVQVFSHGTIPRIRAHPERLHQALSRTLQFADQFSAPNVPLHIRMIATRTAVAITVAQTRRGEPIPDRDTPPLSPNGVLYPVQLIVEAHGGTLACAPDGDGGCSVTITLPVNVERRRERPLRAKPDRRGTSGRVSHREREVLGLLEQGLTNRQIAEHLFLSERTVEHHISRMLARFRLSSRTHLATYALKHDLSGARSSEGG